MIEIKNKDVQALWLLPIEKDFEYKSFDYNFEKCTIIADQNNNLIQLIYDNRFSDLKYTEEKQEIQLVFKESISTSDLIWKCNKRVYDIDKNFSHIFGLNSLNSWDSRYNDVINLNKVEAVLKCGLGDPLNNFFQSSCDLYQNLGGNINMWGLFNFKNEKILPFAYKSIKRIEENKRIKKIDLDPTINVKSPELKEYLIACDNKMLLSMSAILRFLVVHIAEEQLGHDKITELDSREKYREYNEIINLINSECRNIQSNDVKSIKNGIDIASKILHGKTEVTESDWSKLEICFLKLLKYINEVINSIKD